MINFCNEQKKLSPFWHLQLGFSALIVLGDVKPLVAVGWESWVRLTLAACVPVKKKTPQNSSHCEHPAMISSNNHPQRCWGGTAIILSPLETSKIVIWFLTTTSLPYCWRHFSWADYLTIFFVLFALKKSTRPYYRICCIHFVELWHMCKYSINLTKAILELFLVFELCVWA